MSNTPTRTGPIPDRVPCRVCGRRDGLDAVVTDAEWAALGFDPGWYVCLWCMDQRAAELGLTMSATLHFAGDAIYATSDLSGELRAARAQLAAADAFQEFVMPGVYKESCDHGPDYELANPTFYCCDWAEAVTLSDAYRATRSGTDGGARDG